MPVPATAQSNLGRSALRGFGATRWDITLRRQFRFTDKLGLQSRAEFFNILNPPELPQPAGAQLIVLRQRRLSELGLITLRRTEMRRGSFVGIRQPMNVTTAMLCYSPFRLACATDLAEGLRGSWPGQG
jgi:hypothetical protein